MLYSQILKREGKRVAPTLFASPVHGVENLRAPRQRIEFSKKVEARVNFLRFLKSVIFFACAFSAHCNLLLKFALAVSAALSFVDSARRLVCAVSLFWPHYYSRHRNFFDSFVCDRFSVVVCAWSFVRGRLFVVRPQFFVCGFSFLVVCLRSSVRSRLSVTVCQWCSIRGRPFKLVCPWSYLRGHPYVIVRS